MTLLSSRPTCSSFGADSPRETHCLDYCLNSDVLGCIYVSSTVMKQRKNSSRLRLNITKHSRSCYGRQWVSSAPILLIAFSDPGNLQKAHLSRLLNSYIPTQEIDKLICFSEISALFSHYILLNLDRTQLIYFLYIDTVFNFFNLIFLPKLINWELRHVPGPQFYFVALWNSVWLISRDYFELLGLYIFELNLTVLSRPWRSCLQTLYQAQTFEDIEVMLLLLT